MLNVNGIPWFFDVWRNLSNLNLGGEISPAIGDLGNLESMWSSSVFLFRCNFLLLYCSRDFDGRILCLLLIETCKGISWPVKSPMRLATALLSYICKFFPWLLPTIFFFFFFSPAELFDFRFAFANLLYCNVGICLTMFCMETYHSPCRSLRSWSFCKWF